MTLVPPFNKDTANRDRVLGLFKFGSSIRIESFVRNGQLFMNTLDYFRTFEAKDSERHDKAEGTEWCMQPDQVRIKLQVDGTFKDIPGINGPILYSHPMERRINVFCMYALRPPTNQCAIDPRNFNFGDTFAALLDGEEFLRRVHAAALRRQLVIEWKLVEYVDRVSHNGAMGPFRKFSPLSYQSEFRLALFPGTGEPFILEVGDLSDICALGPLHELNDRLVLDQNHFTK